MKRSSRTRTGVVALTALLALTACSNGADEADQKNNKQQAAQAQKTAEAEKQVADNLAALPARPTGLIDVDGTTNGTLTSAAATEFSATEGDATVNISDSGEDTAYAKLCAGQVDIVDSGREISEKEWQACRDNGLSVVQMQVAADAIVMATKSQTNVGGDCIDTTQAKDMFRAGSPLTNWSQVAFANVPLVVGGPDASDAAFDFFGRYVLDSPNPGLPNLRSDYQAFSSDSEARTFVTGTADDAELAAFLTSRTQTAAQLKLQLDTAQTTLDSAKAEVKAAEADRQKGIADRRSPSQQAKDQARQDASYARRSDAIVDYNAIKDKLDKANSAAAAAQAAQTRLDALRGHVSYFRFSYYELFEEELRPFEVTSADGARNCIFPSEATISNGTYPLSRRLLLTTTTRSLKRQEVGAFLKSYLDDAPTLAAKQRLVALPTDVATTQKSWINGTAAPELVRFGAATTAGQNVKPPAR